MNRRQILGAAVAPVLAPFVAEPPRVTYSRVVLDETIEVVSELVIVVERKQLRALVTAWDFAHKVRPAGWALKRPFWLPDTVADVDERIMIVQGEPFQRRGSYTVSDAGQRIVFAPATLADCRAQGVDSEDVLATWCDVAAADLEELEARTVFAAWRDAWTLVYAP